MKRGWFNVKLKVWFAEVRPQFLLLSIVLILLGTAVAVYEGFFNPAHFLLALIGLLLLHISVNVLNDYFDYKSGIDLEAKRTPFSGGSGILPAQLLDPAPVYRLGVVCLLLGLTVGAYFVAVMGLLLLPIIVIGAIATYFYTTHFAKWMLGEVFAGLGLGALPILGAYFVQAGTYSSTAIAASVPPFILVFNLLFLNEFPDVEPDAKHGRKNLVIVLGRPRAAKLYGVLTVAMYCWIVISTVANLMPSTILISLTTLPFAVKAINNAVKHYSSNRIITALSANVITVLLTQTLMALGFLLAFLLRL